MSMWAAPLSSVGPRGELRAGGCATGSARAPCGRQPGQAGALACLSDSGASAPATLPAGKSSLAQQLASRLNLPNVLQTDVLYEVGARSGCWRSRVFRPRTGLPLGGERRRWHAPPASGPCLLGAAVSTCRLPPTSPPAPPLAHLQLLRASGMGDLPAEPLWRRPLPAGLGAVAAFQRECATIRQALDGELCKVCVCVCCCWWWCGGCGGPLTAMSGEWRAGPRPVSRCLPHWGCRTGEGAGRAGCAGAARCRLGPVHTTSCFPAMPVPLNGPLAVHP